ncbi:hypothetical protein [uncultured Corynebacterium sp.]|uniref:hypothetical protein n=1 Tax=uncultured Corynebacterium sp. TaxID=159447 RepID=UPI0025DB2EF4|nr:hypothetical protein [uncultured Corynebacterium sp.]
MQRKTAYTLYFILLFFGIGAIAAGFDGSSLAKPMMIIVLVASLIFSFVVTYGKRNKGDR